MNWFKENWLTLIIVFVSAIVYILAASHFSNKKLNKIQDRLIEAFGLIFTLFVCSIALPLACGIILLLGEIAQLFMDLSWSIKAPISLGVGILLTIWLYKKRNKGTNYDLA